MQVWLGSPGVCAPCLAPAHLVKGWPSLFCKPGPLGLRFQSEPNHGLMVMTDDLS